MRHRSEPYLFASAHLSRRLRFLFPAALVMLSACLCPWQEASARIRLENICSVYGQKEIKLTGIGLVVGLPGTGDGNKNLPTVRALAAALKLMNAPVLDPRELKAENVAIVLIEGTVPKTGLKIGQSIDCHVSSIMGAKSLRGGRLLLSPVETADIRDDRPVGLATGPVRIEGDVPTTGRIPGGIVLEENLLSEFIDRERGHIVTLLLDGAHASFRSASEVAYVINEEFRFEVGRDLARPVGPGFVEVVVPEAYRETPVRFVADLLGVGIDNPHSQARVVVNQDTETVIVTGEVEISPTLIAHKNLTVQIGGTPLPGGAPEGGRFVPLMDQQLGAGASPTQLKQLVDALNQLRVPTADVISIIRELQRTGKLHAIYDDH
jgi:flagellar P-ring protein FlgI